MARTDTCLKIRSPVGRGFGATFRCYFHWTLLPVVGLTLLLWLTATKFATKEFVAAIVGVSGTLVALMIPAVGLAGSFITARLEDLAAATDAASRGVLKDLASVSKPLWRGLVFMVTSLPLSIAAFYLLPTDNSSPTNSHILLAASIALILIGVVSTLPFAWRALLQDTLDRINELDFPPDTRVGTAKGTSTSSSAGSSADVAALIRTAHDLLREAVNSSPTQEAEKTA